MEKAAPQRERLAGQGRGRKKQKDTKPPVTEQELLDSITKLEHWQNEIAAIQTEMDAHLKELKKRDVDIALFKQAFKLWQGEKRDTFALYWKLLARNLMVDPESSDDDDTEDPVTEHVFNPFTK
jgi:hypothetical protein